MEAMAHLWIFMVYWLSNGDFLHSYVSFPEGSESDSKPHIFGTFITIYVYIMRICIYDV